MMLYPGDIVCTKGTSLISRLIRVFSRTGGESRTEINHVGVIVEQGNFQNAVLVEASHKTESNWMLKYYDDPKTDIAIFRPTNIDFYQEDLIKHKAESYVGRRYGYFKIVAHFIDYLLGGRYVARRLTGMGRYPICSWVVADAYAAAGLDFGVPVGQAQPDDIWDFCIANPDKYTLIHSLGRLV